MRLKATPEDFVVREAAGLRIRKQPAPYRVYMLEKTGWNTVDALMRIAKEKRVSYERVAYGGKKDRHAHTFQYVTIQAPIDCSLTAKGYNLKFLGFSNEPMSPAQIVANHFELTVRELTEAEAARLVAGAALVKEQGVINYFDDQRFGNLDKERGYIAERMLQGRWDEALNMALTSIYPEESREAKERKRALRERWGDWPACRALAVTALEQRAFDLLQTHPHAFRDALSTVHKETANMWVSTYQAFLWNETVRRLLAARDWGGGSVPGPAGPYVFANDRGARMGDMVIPLPGKGMRFDEPEAGMVLEEVLRERRLRPVALEQDLLGGASFRAAPRPVLMRPSGVWVDGPFPDDLYPGHTKVTLRFTLPRGSYATMLVKGLMAGE